MFCVLLGYDVLVFIIWFSDCDWGCRCVEFDVGCVWVVLVEYLVSVVEWVWSLGSCCVGLSVVWVFFFSGCSVNVVLFWFGVEFEWLIVLGGCRGVLVKGFVVCDCRSVELFRLLSEWNGECFL